MRISSWRFRTLCGLTLALLCGAATLRAAPEDWTPRETRTHFQEMLKRPIVPLEPSSRTETDGKFRVERGQFSSEADKTVPFLVVRPAEATGPLPAVLVLHGTGGNKEGVIGVLKALAGRGLFAIAIDARYQGERIPGGAHGASEYQDAILRAWEEKDPRKQEHPFYYDTVYDIWRTVDYLEERKEVDGKRIGIMGFSMGGIETWLAAAGDERLRVVVPAIGVQSLQWSLENGQWQGRAATIGKVHSEVAKEMGKKEVDAEVCRKLWNKLIPGILDRYDCPRMLEAIAPRPLLILNGEKDPNCPLGGAKLAFAAAEKAYKEAGASDRLKIDVAPGVAHAVTPQQHEEAYDWFARWLKQ